MDFNEKSVEELLERRAAIAVEVDAEDADLDALENEARAINTELERRKQEAAKKAEIRSAVASGDGQVETKFAEARKDKKSMDIREVRNSDAYVKAFAKYIKTGKDEECRTILSTNADPESLPEGVNFDGPVPVPTFIEGRVRTAWEKLGLMALVRKTYLRGNVQVGFELTADPAQLHFEGSGPISEESLTFGVVTLTAVSIKKMVRVSDEALDYGDREFLEYLYDEITYRIASAAESLLLQMIAMSNSEASHEAVGVPVINDNGNDLLSIVARAYSVLSDEATNPVIVMNKQTYAAFIAARNAAGYGVDPFMGLPVYFNSNMGVLGASDESGMPWLIVGDFGRGAQANFPNGEEIRIKTDETTEMDADIVRILGRMFIGMNLVADRAFCKVVAGESGGDGE